MASTEVSRVRSRHWRDIASVLTRAFCRDENYLSFSPGVAAGDLGAAVVEMAMSCKTHRAYAFPFFAATRDNRFVGAMLLQDPFDCVMPPWIIRFWLKQGWKSVFRRLGMDGRRFQIECATELESHDPPPYCHCVSHIAVLPDVQDEGVGRQLLDAAYQHACSNPASRGLLLATYSPRFADSLEKRGWLVHRTGTHGTVRGASCFLANTAFDEAKATR